MSKSLAELRQSSRVGLPTRSFPLCLAPKLAGEVQELLDELQAAMIREAAQTKGDESAAPPKRMGERLRSAEIRERLAEVQAEAEEHTGTLTLQGFTEGQWRIWCDEHPAREDNKRDDEIAHGYCNADDLVDELWRWAHSWNGEPMKPPSFDSEGKMTDLGDWSIIRENAAPAEIKQLAGLVVAIHENAVNLPKLLSSSLATLDDASD